MSASVSNTPLIQPQSALEHLDRVQHLSDLNEFEPEHFFHALQVDLGPDAAADVADADPLLARASAQLDALHQVLAAIEPFARKIMGIRLLHVLSNEPVSPQLRPLLSATILSYAGDLRVLAQRLERSVSVTALDAILAAAEAVLELRHTLQQGVFVLGQRVATSYLPRVVKAARSPLLSAAQATRARQAVLDLQQVAQTPLRLLAEPFEARIKKLPVPEADALPEPEPNRRSDASPGAEIPSTHGRFALLEID